MMEYSEDDEEDTTRITGERERVDDLDAVKHSTGKKHTLIFSNQLLTGSQKRKANISPFCL